MKKKKIIILSILVIFIIAMICGVIWYFNNRNSNYKPNGKLNYDTVLVNEETNPYYQVGFADYVFIGKVDKEIERTFSDYGSARTIYEIEVTENLKVMFLLVACCRKSLYSSLMKATRSV